MRNTLIILPLMLCSAPALAQAAPPPPPPPPPQSQLPPQLVNDETLDRLADGMRALSHALLDMRVGALKATVEGRDLTQAEKHLTVRDLARRDDPDFERHLDQQIAAARPKVERTMRALNDALPEIMDDLDRAQDAVERATANIPQRGYPRR